MKDIFSILLLCLAATMTTAQNCEIKYRQVTENQDYTFNFVDSLTYTKALSLSSTYERQIIKPDNESEIVSKYSEAFPMDGDCRTTIDHIQKYYFGFPLDTIDDPKLELTYEFIGTYCDQILIRIQGWDSSEYFTVAMNDGTVHRLPGMPITYDCSTVFSYGDIMADGVATVVNLQANRQYTISFTDWQVTESKQTSNEVYVTLEWNSIYCSGIKKYGRFKLK